MYVAYIYPITLTQYPHYTAIDNDRVYNILYMTLFSTEQYTIDKESYKC